MQQRYVSIWFRYLKTDWHTRRAAELAGQPLVLYAPQQGRMLVTAANQLAEDRGIGAGMVLADARAMVPSLQVRPDDEALFQQVLHRFGVWFIRYSPVVALHPPDGLLLEATGCTHLWGGEDKYLADISRRLHEQGYDIRLAMAGTIGAAWAVAHFGSSHSIVLPGHEAQALGSLPPSALRIDRPLAERLHKLGFYRIAQLAGIPAAALRRRFGQQLVQQLHCAYGYQPCHEELQLVVAPAAYQQRLPCLEPIITATGIEIAMRQLLQEMCARLQQEQKGLRTACIKAYRLDGKVEEASVQLSRPSADADHILQLLVQKIDGMAPGPGIELFTLEAGQVTDHHPQQEQLWNEASGLTDVQLAQLVDRLANRLGQPAIQRYLPAEHYLPERSVRATTDLAEQPATGWQVPHPRPLNILRRPLPISVSAPVPDYPPMLFKLQGVVHRIVKADGPERIEQEWWLQDGELRDYYYVEDEAGHRYWLFRQGHYRTHPPNQWFLHGYGA
jgi:protein ImuB